MKANEFVTEAPRTAAAIPEIVSVQDDGKTITIKVRGHDGTVRAISNSNPAVLQQQLNLKYGLRLPHSIARKFVGMPASMAEDQADNPDSWESQAADAERDAETVRMADQDAAAGGLAETINPDILNPKFSHKQEIGDFTYTASVEQGKQSSQPYPGAPITDVGTSNPYYVVTWLNIKCFDNNKKIGQSIFEIKSNEKRQQWLESYQTSVEKSYQNRGIASTMYAYAKMLGNDIKSSSSQSLQGQSMWKAWRKSGEAKHLTKMSKPVQSTAEEQLDEKSTSQAQFRTMAAAAHNPKFAKKVGISPDVAREFHGADKKSNYKSLPKKAAEDASWGMAPEGRGYKK